MGNKIAIGVAYKDQDLDGSTIANATITSPTITSPTITGATYAGSVAATTLSASGATTLNGDVAVCNSATDLLGFHGATAVDQSATVSAVTTTAAVVVSGTLVYGFETAAQADLIVTAINALRVCVREKGLMA
jgi:hypothetical protein